MHYTSLSLFLSRLFIQISVKLLYSTMCEKCVQFYGVHIRGKCIDSRHLYSCFSPLNPPLPTPPPSSSCLHTLGRRKLLIPPGSILSKICFPQQQKEVEETMFCLMKNQSENIKMTWNIRFFLTSGICFILWLLLCKHDNLMLKLHAKK